MQQNLAPNSRSGTSGTSKQNAHHSDDGKRRSRGQEIAALVVKVYKADK